MKRVKKGTGANKRAGKTRRIIRRKLGRARNSTAEALAEPVSPKAIPTSYEEALLGGMMQPNTGKISRQAFALTSTLASLTPKLREVYFTHGFAVGKALYRSMPNQMDSKTPTPIPVLVDFFNRAGYAGVSYRRRGNGYEFEIRDTPSMDIGVNTHMFEAGIISGFMSAEYRRVSSFSESECRSNGADSCTFVEEESEANEHMDLDAGIGGFAKYVLGTMDMDRREWMNYGYYNLASDSLLHGEYASGINDIAYVTGSRIGGMLRKESAGISAAAREARLRRLITLLNFGSITVKRISPVSLRLEFDRLITKKGMATLASNFINGMLNAYLGSRLNETQRSSFGRYVIDIREVSQAKTRSKKAGKV